MTDLYNKARNETTQVFEPVKKEAEETGTFDKFKAAAFKAYFIDTKSGSENISTKLLKESYNKVIKLNPEMGFFKTTKAVPAELTLGFSEDDYVKFFEDNAESIETLKEKDPSILNMQQIQEVEDQQLGQIYQEYNDVTNEDNSLVDIAAIFGGYMLGYVRDEFNALAITAGFNPVAGASFKYNAARVGASEAGVEAGLSLRNKPAEVATRRRLGEEVTTSEAIGEAAIEIGAAAGLGAIAGGFVGKLLKTELPNVPKGKTLEEHTAKLGDEYINKIHDAEIPTVKIEEAPKVFDIDIDDAIVSEVRTKDIKLAESFDEAGNILEFRSSKEIIQELDDEIEISSLIDTCLRG